MEHQFNPVSYRTHLSRLLFSADRQTRSAGKYWYLFAHQFVRMLSAQFGVKLDIVAHVVSCLSPAVNWQRNMRDTIALLDAYASGESLDAVRVSTYGHQGRKAIDILETQDVGLIGNGDKTRNFALNLSGNFNAVTVDSHIYHAALGLSTTRWSDPPPNITPKRYREIADVIREFACEAGYSPAQMQAILWGTHKAQIEKRRKSTRVETETAPF